MLSPFVLPTFLPVAKTIFAGFRGGGEFACGVLLEIGQFALFCFVPVVVLVLEQMTFSGRRGTSSIILIVRRRGTARRRID